MKKSRKNSSSNKRENALSNLPLKKTSSTLRPFKDQSNNNKPSGYLAQLQGHQHFSTSAQNINRELRYRANQVAFSPVEIIHEVNEDVNSSYQSTSNEHKTVKRCQSNLRATQSQVIHILISQNEKGDGGGEGRQAEEKE